MVRSSRVGESSSDNISTYVSIDTSRFSTVNGEINIDTLLNDKKENEEILKTNVSFLFTIKIILFLLIVFFI